MNGIHLFHYLDLHEGYIDLKVVVEGPTEERFVRNVLTPHFAPLGIYAAPVIVKTRIEADGRRRAGGGDWQKWRRDISLLLKNFSPRLRVTTLFDLYGLPADFPKREEQAAIRDSRRRADLLEKTMAAEIGDLRFVPYLQRHEFEALVLAGLDHLQPLLATPQDRNGLRRLRAEIGDQPPEDVNDGANTAPSKRLARFIPSYDPPVGKKTAGNGKSVYGPAVT